MQRSATDTTTEKQKKKKKQIRNVEVNAPDMCKKEKMRKLSPLGKDLTFPHVSPVFKTIILTSHLKDTHFLSYVSLPLVPSTADFPHVGKAQ